jgi:hypothetical protein
MELWHSLEVYSINDQQMPILKRQQCISTILSFMAFFSSLYLLSFVLASAFLLAIDLKI